MIIEERQRINRGIWAKKAFPLEKCAMVYLIVDNKRRVKRETNAKEN